MHGRERRFRSFVDPHECRGAFGRGGGGAGGGGGAAGYPGGGGGIPGFSGGGIPGSNMSPAGGETGSPDSKRLKMLRFVIQFAYQPPKTGENTEGAEPSEGAEAKAKPAAPTANTD